MKNIIVCSDGTGNSAIKGRGTNVFKLFEAIDLNGHRHDPTKRPQVALYDDGVGTQSFKVFKIIAGATGWGLSRNVKQLYKEIVRIYDPEDQIFLFGFSRGAFTVRTLADLIHTCGILDASCFKTANALEAAVDKVYRLYREGYRTKLAELFRGKPDGTRVARFREEKCVKGEVNIAFLGVWDTVDAVGLPLGISNLINATIYRFKFPNLKLGACVKRACHALAVDDERESFHPLLWKEDPRIEQVWFAGVHSNVGGGYPKQGMSLVTLDWMIAKAEEAGLRVVDLDRELYRDHATVDDKLYNPRAGLGVFYRWRPRDITEMCGKHGITPKLHLSLLERIAHGTDDYAPGNLPPDSKVVFTSTGNPVKDETLSLRAEEVGKVFRAAHADGKPLLARVRPTVAMGRVSYFLFLFSTLATLFVASAPAGGGFMERVTGAKALIGHLLALRLGELVGIVTQIGWPWRIALVTGFLLSWAMAYFVNWKMSDVFSEFWHDQQWHLRDALKRARAMAAAPALPAGSGTAPVLPLTVLGGQGGSQGASLPIVLLPDGDGRGAQPGSAGTPPKL